MAATTQTVERNSESPHLRAGERLRLLVAHREILANLIRKELKVKYVASVLGAIWSLLNPLVYLAVFTFVTRVLGSGLPDYPVYLLSGLLAWNLFSAAALGGSRSVIDNANLVKKVSFPREILPMAAIGVALVDFGLQMIVFVVFIVVSGHGLSLPELALLPLAFAALLTFTTALTLWVAALNVRYRDVGHLLNIGLLVWFWVTPIVYASGQVQQHLEGQELLQVLYFCNPLTAVVEGMHRALYGVQHLPGGVTATWDMPLGTLTLIVAAMLAASLIFLRFTWGSFFVRSGDFAEEL
jgi:ABC-2 type transport system permease protein